MSSDHPLFDDEELPAWMRGTGLSSDSSGAEAASEPATEEPGPAPSNTSSAADSGDLSWLDDVNLSAGPQGTALAGRASPPASPPDAEDLSWLTSVSPATSTPGSAELSDMPAWAQDPADAKTEESPFDDTQDISGLPTNNFGWDQSSDGNAPAQGKPGLTSSLPWREGASDPRPSLPDQSDNAIFRTPAPTDSSNTSRASSDEDLDWLSQLDSATSTPGPAISPAAPEELPAWESSAAPEAAGEPEVPRAPEAPVRKITPLKSLSKPTPVTPPSAQPPAADNAPRPSIKRLGGTPAPTPPPVSKEKPAPAIKRLPGKPVEPPQAAPTSYTDWEQAQNVPEPEPALPDPSIDDIPDWFKSEEEPPQEQPAEDAPDWFKDMDLTGTALVGPDTVPGPASAVQPAAPDSSGNDVPDWFTGSGQGVEGIDFNAMFVAETPPAVISEPVAEEEEPTEPSEPTEPMEPTEPEEPQEANDPQPWPETAAAPEPMSDTPEMADTLDTVATTAMPDAELTELTEPTNATEATEAIESGSVADSLASPDSSAAQATPAEQDQDWMADMPALDDLLSTSEFAQVPAQDQSPVQDEMEEQPVSEHLEPALDSLPSQPDTMLDLESLDSPDWSADQHDESAQSDNGADSSAELTPESGTASAELGDVLDIPLNLADAPDRDRDSDTDDASLGDTPDDNLDLGEAAEAGEMPDWMAQMAAEPATSPQATSVSDEEAEPAEAESGDMPDWMAQMAAEPATSPQATSVSDEEAEPAEAEAGDMPDWMAQMGVAAPASMDQPDQSDAQVAEDSTENDWLADFAAGSDIMGVVAPTPMDVLDQPDTQTVEDLDENLIDDNRLPDFDDGSELMGDAAPESVAVEPAPSLADGVLDIDALLSFAESASAANAAAQSVAFEAAKAEAEAADAMPESSNMDFDFDSELGLPMNASSADEAQASPPASGPHEFDVEALTAALAAAAKQEPEPTKKRETGALRRLPAATPTLTDGTASEGELVPEVPEWLSDKNPVGPVVLRIGDQEVRFQDKPVNILPEQLQQLRSKARETGRKPDENTAVSSGPLSGITGALDMATETIYPSQPGISARMIVSDLEAKRIKIIQDILGVEEEMLRERAMSDEEREAKQAAEGVKSSAPTVSPIKWDRAVVTLVLVLGIIAPFFTSFLNITPPVDSTQLSAAQTNVAQAMDGIGADQSVLVAFEYGPTGAGELDDLARDVLRDIVKQGAHPVIVSSNPAGALHAEELMAALSRNVDDLYLMGRADKPLVARQDYSVLRYLPGGSIGVRDLLNAVVKGNATQIEFATDIEGQPSGVTDVSVNTLSHNPAFILTENPEDVRNWVELYRVDPPLDPLKIVLLSSASASAVAQTYATANDKRIIGPLVGLRDAMIYQAVRQPVTDDKATALSAERWQSIGLGTLLAALLILAGTLYYAIRGFQRRIRR